jgi:hypothetical protein
MRFQDSETLVISHLPSFLVGGPAIEGFLTGSPSYRFRRITVPDRPDWVAMTYHVLQCTNHSRL